MRRRQAEIAVRHLKPVPAAVVLVGSGLSEDVMTELLTPIVLADFRSRLRGEECARACHTWVTAVNSGAWNWSRPGSLAAYLTVVRRHAAGAEFKHRHLKIGRHTVHREPVTTVDFDADRFADEQAEYLVSEIRRPSTADNPTQPAVLKRTALIHACFPREVELAPISQTQARNAITFGNRHGVVATARDVLGGVGDAAVAAIVFPFLSGVPHQYQLEILDVFAAWVEACAATALRLLCYHDTMRRGPNAGQYPAHICVAGDAPVLDELVV